MNFNLIAQILQLQVKIQGAQAAIQLIQQIARTFGATKEQVASLTAALYSLAAFTGLIKFAAETETLYARIRGFVGSAVVASSQLYLMNKLASEGVFNRAEWGEAIELMDKANLSISGNVDLLKTLGVRMHSLTEAARLIEMIEGAAPGPIPRIVNQLYNAGITPEMLQQHGVKVLGRSVVSGKDTLLKAIKEIAAGDDAYKLMQNTFEGSLKSLINQIQRLADSVMTPLIKGFTTVVKLLADAFDWMKDLNDATGGWAGYLMEGGLIVKGLTLVYGLLQNSVVAQIALTVWTWLQGGGIKKAITGLIAMIASIDIAAIAQGTLSWLAGIMAWAYGNVGPILTLIASGLALGGIIWGADKMVNDYRDAKEAENQDIDKPGSSKGRAVRHDDIENTYNRMHGWNLSAG